MNLFFKLTKTAKCLLIARGLRSFSQGLMVVDFALLLNQRGWTGAQIGGLLSTIGIFTAVGAMIAGPLGDKYGRRTFLLCYEIGLILAALIVFATSQFTLVLIASCIGSFGRGANGAAGPFGPLEQAWLAGEIDPVESGQVFSLNSTIGFIGLGFGALCAAIPALAARLANTSDIPYRMIFLFSMTMSVIGFCVLLQSREAPRVKKPSEHRLRLTKEEKLSLSKLGGMNALNSFAIGFTGPLVSYWLFRRFHVGAELIGPFQAVSFGVTAIASSINGRASKTVGIVRSVVIARSLGLVTLLLIPLMPTFWLASALMVLRSAFNRGTIGNRNALTGQLVRKENQGLAYSVASGTAQFPQAIGPSFAGPMIAAGWFETPFYIAALFQAIYVSLYKPAFGEYEKGSPKYSNIPDSEIEPREVVPE